LLNNSEKVKATKSLKENKNVCKEKINSSLEVLESVSATTIQGVHEKCSDSDLCLFKLMIAMTIYWSNWNLLVKLINFPVTLNFILP